PFRRPVPGRVPGSPPRTQPRPRRTPCTRCSKSYSSTPTPMTRPANMTGGAARAGPGEPGRPWSSGPPPGTGRTGRGPSPRPTVPCLTLDTPRTGWCQMLTVPQITQLDVNGVRCQALFSFTLQPSDFPTADMVAAAISRAVQQFGIGGCAGRMAQEFGDHPDAAATPMRRGRQLLAPGATHQPH